MSDSAATTGMTTLRTLAGRRMRRVVMSGLLTAGLLSALMVGAPAAHADQYVGTSFTSYLLKGEYILSPNKLYKFIMQSDGNLVLYRRYNTDILAPWYACWGSNTVGTGVYAEYWKESSTVAYLKVGSTVLYGAYIGSFYSTNVNVTDAGWVYVAWSAKVHC
ncbi:hypothetical protein Psi02_08600 [Planotetraspora silvatica]|uniref:Uncharacterized protein n=2 Tax=Planotetraspora silvatica TaxID=234614 RepID=A0A8J3XLR3_9ACTN|nr:hypothetical protein Psi02_08600 [Planotetraspora silvatica]